MGPAEQQLAYTQYASENFRNWVQTGAQMAQISQQAAIARQQQATREKEYQLEQEKWEAEKAAGMPGLRAKALNAQIESTYLETARLKDLLPEQLKQARETTIALQRKNELDAAVTQNMGPYIDIVSKEVAQNRIRASYLQPTSWESTDKFLHSNPLFATDKNVLAIRDQARAEVDNYSRFSMGEAQQMIGTAANYRMQARQLMEADPANEGLASMLLEQADRMTEYLNNRYTRRGRVSPFSQGEDVPLIELPGGVPAYDTGTSVQIIPDREYEAEIRAAEKALEIGLKDASTTDETKAAWDAFRASATTARENRSARFRGEVAPKGKQEEPPPPPPKLSKEEVRKYATEELRKAKTPASKAAIKAEYKRITGEDY